MVGIVDDFNEKYLEFWFVVCEKDGIYSIFFSFYLD